MTPVLCVYTCGRSCGARVRKRRKEKHELQIGEYRYNIVFAKKGAYHGRTRCVSGLPHAADLSAVAEAEGCSNALVGAQLWLWQITAARKAATAHTVGPLRKLWSTETYPICIIPRVTVDQISTWFSVDDAMSDAAAAVVHAFGVKLLILARFDVGKF